MKEPVDHIIRPQLPWRSNDGAITECGHDASEMPSITREAFFQRLKDLGQQRTAMLTCMTCLETARRWDAWEDDPLRALGREIEWERGGFHFRARTDRGHRLKDELLAVASLIDGHREEFDQHIEAAERRRSWLEQKAALEQRTSSKPKQKRL